MVLQKGVELQFRDVGNDLYQPFLTAGSRHRRIPLLLEKRQIGKVEELISKINHPVTNFEFFCMVVIGGIRVAMRY